MKWEHVFVLDGKKESIHQEPISTLILELLHIADVARFNSDIRQTADSSTESWTGKLWVELGKGIGQDRSTFEETFL